MRLLFLSSLIIEGTQGSVTRLRKFFDHIKSFARETSETTAPSTETSTVITDSAIRFANNEGSDLENFLTALRAADSIGIGKRDIDSLVWEAVDRLYNEAREVKVEESKVSNIEVIPLSTTPDPDSIEPELPEIRKRERDEGLSENTIVKKPAINESLRETLIKEIKTSPVDTRARFKPNAGFKWLQYKLYVNAIEGNLKWIEAQLHFLQDANCLFIKQLFRDALMVLENPRFRLTDSVVLRELMKATRKIELQDKQEVVTRSSLLKKISNYFHNPSHEPSVSQIMIRDHLYELLVKGDLQTFNDFLHLMERGYVRASDIGAILGKSFHYLKTHEK